MFKKSTLLIVLCAACAPQDEVVSTGRARFPEFPEGLYAAFQASCTNPSQSYFRPEPGFAECRELLPPETTAAIILGFDGTIEDLPELIIRFSTIQDGATFLVQNDIFLNVPQKNADAIEVRMPDRRISRTIDRLYRRAGGMPEPGLPSSPPLPEPG